MVGGKPPVTCPSCGTVATSPAGFCASCGKRLPAAPSSPQVNNPYAAPMEAPAAAPVMHGSAVYPASVVKQAEAIIKDAGHVVLAVLIGFLCTTIAWLVIGPWFFYRLICWNRLAREYPMLLHNNASTGGLEYRFRAARVRLIAGVVIGAGMLIVMCVTVVLISVMG